MSEELQKIKMNGLHIRPEILNLLENKTITSSEFPLLIYMDNIIISAGDFFTYSNKWIAKRLGVKTGRVSKMLSKLKNSHLILPNKFDGKTRKLITIFQVLDKEKIEKENKKLFKKGRVALKDDSIYEGSPKGLASIIYIHFILKKLNKKIYIYRQALKDYTTRSAKSLFGRKKYHPRWKIYAKKLAKVVQEVWSYQPNETGWHRSLEKIQSVHGVPIPRIKKALDWYCKSRLEAGIPEEGDETYLPVIKTGAQFLGKFLTIEDAMRRERRQIKRFQEKEYTPGGPVPIISTVVGEYDPDEDEEGAWQKD